MKKEELLQQIKCFAAQYLVTREEVLGAYDEGLGIKTSLVPGHKVSVAETLYYIGGAIVFLGISFFVWRTWGTHGIVTKILATLGSGIAAYTVGGLFSRDERLGTVGSAFYLISALVMPIGLYVVFDNAGFDAKSYGTQSLISGILFATYLASYFVFQKDIFALFSIIFGTWFFFVFIDLIVGGRPQFSDLKFFEYRALAAGLAYILLGYSFAQNKKALTGFLYSFGILGFLGAALALGDWSPNQNIFWELIFPGLALGTVLLSIYLKSKSFLIFGFLYLIAYIFKITDEYFKTGLSWPFALVVAGLMLIVAGYVSFYLNKKYISS